MIPTVEFYPLALMVETDAVQAKPARSEEWRIEAASIQMDTREAIFWSVLESGSRWMLGEGRVGDMEGFGRGEVRGKMGDDRPSPNLLTGPFKIA
jgi:hypothetical protein